jgi:hypothetical protein
MKAKSKTGGGKITVKKPTSAREKPNLTNNIRKSPTQTNPKKEAPKKDTKKPKTKEPEKTKSIPQKGKDSNLNREEKEKLDKEKELLSSLQKTNKDFIKVYVRFRPLNDLENDLLSDNCGWETPKYLSDTQIGIYSTKEVKDTNAQIPTNLIFKYDKIFNSESQQNQVYENVGKRIVGDVMEGYNGTIFAYGQSGSGKTYTMYGPDIYDDVYKGIIPRIVEDIFNYVEKADDNIDFQFKLSVLEIYKEVMYDLLTQQSADIKIQENPETGMVIEGLSEVYLSSIDEFFEYVDLSQSNRKVAETKLNHNSSRSHCILILEVTQSFKKEKLIKKGTLNLVDLAGSEKVSKTGAVGLTLEEAKKINLSLSTLGNVIHALTHKSEHIPYRDSKLTRLLKESLGGNYKTSLIVTCSPHSYNLDEVISSLLFAKRVKTIKNVVKVNIKYSYEELQKMVYLLNAKLKRALNGEIEEENAEKENEDNFMCSNCKLLTKEKNLLEAKVQSLLDTIHQKDLEIAKLKEMLGLSDKADVMMMDEKKGKKKKHKKKDKGEKGEKGEKEGKGKKDVKNKKKDGKKVGIKDKKGNQASSDESSDEETSEENDKDDNSLFEEKDEKEKKVNSLYNKVKDKLSKIQEENARINIIQNEEEELRKIELKIDSFNKAIHNYIKDKDKNKCFLKMDEMIKQSILMVKNVDYKKGFDEYKENMAKIFDDNIKNMKTQTDLSHSFNIYFFYEYLRFYFNNQIIIQGYRKLILDNRSLEKMNTYLFDIVHDILSVNFDIANDNVINANALNLLKASLVGDSFVQNPALLHGGNIDLGNLGKKFGFALGSDIHQKIIKIVSRKNLNLLKNSFASPNSQKASLAINDPKNAQNALNLMNSSQEANIALINKLKSQETEKSESKLQMIRNVLIQEIKETDLIKKNMEELKEYINNIINLNINFFNQRILNGTGNLSLVTQKKVIKDSVENLQNNLEDDNTEYIAIETNIAIKNNKVENVENKEKEEKEEKKEEVEKISEEKNLEHDDNME